MDETNSVADLRGKLAEFATRAVGIKSGCTNEQSTKFFLVMPFLGFLGYDYTTPLEVHPEHIADFGADPLNKVDFAILRDGVPIVAIECKKVGADLVDNRGRLRSYFNALVDTKLGILTDGIVYEFFVDSIEPNIMDEDPFLTLDLETAARGAVTAEVLETLFCVTKAKFDPADIAETAHLRLVQKRLRSALASELANPSEDFCRILLKSIGMKVSAAAIHRHYGPMIQRALGQLRTEADREPKGAIDPVSISDQRIFTTDHEFEVFDYVRRRLAFLVNDDALFDAIDGVRYKDFIGKLKVYYCKENKGRLFDFIEGTDGSDTFIFPVPIGSIVTDDLREIDGALKATFTARVKALLDETPAAKPVARSA
jgi:predicted type IV restriction endonuclease